MHIEGDSFEVTFEPLAGFGLSNLLRITAQNKFNISPRYSPRILYSFFLSSILTPFRFKETMKYQKIIENTQIKEHPLFIIGHWRSGTTYLHNMLSLNDYYGYCSTYHTTVPSVFLSNEKFIKPIVAASLPQKRPQDDVPLGADLPQEEEYGIGALYPYAYYNGWCFPKNMRFYNQFVCFDGVPEDIVEKWKETYLFLLKKISIYNNEKRLILKNPANTARIKLILDLFPEAQFVHIIRNPYEVYYSMMRFMDVIISKYCVQTPPKNILDAMMDLYLDIYDKYLSERELIPEKNLIEVTYEDLLQKPYETVNVVYKKFNLKKDSINQQKLEQFIQEQKKIKISSYKMDEEIKDRIYKKWKKTFDAFEYTA